MKNNSKTFREVPKQKMIERGLNVVAGVDLGDKHSQVCLIDLDGKVVERTKLRGGRRREVGTLSQEKVQEGER